MTETATRADTEEKLPTSDPEQARQYEKTRLWITAASFAIGVAAPLIFLLTAGSEGLRNVAEGWSADPSLGLFYYVLIAIAGYTALTFPLDMYSGYFVERRYGLSRIGRRQWFADWAKGQGVQLVFAVGAVEAIYALMRALPGSWWVAAAAGFALFIVILAALAPVLLFPIFYKFEPLPDGELKERLLRLSERLKVSVRGVYIWKMGEKTRKANAALAGWGRTRRILLSDTLILEHEPDEIEVVLAHEMGHQVNRDIWRGLAIQTVLMFAAFYAIHLALQTLTGPLGLRSVSDFANMPLLLLIAGAVAVIALPLANAISRRAERAADRFALERTGLIEPFISAMEKLAAQNLSRKDPHPLVEFALHSHPSVQKRIAFAREWKRQSPLPSG